jgi:hypothetical protein
MAAPCLALQLGARTKDFTPRAGTSTGTGGKRSAAPVPPVFWAMISGLAWSGHRLGDEANTAGEMN